MPIQQMLLGVGASGDSYWWQRCDQSDASNSYDNSSYPFGRGWSRGNTIIVDDDENSYFFAKNQSSYARTMILGFDKDGTNIVKSYGGDWVNSGQSTPTSQSFSIYAKSGFKFDNKLYFAGMGSQGVGDNAGTCIDIVDVTSGQTPSGHKQHKFSVSGHSKYHQPFFLVGRMGSGLTHSVNFTGHQSTRLTIPDSDDFDLGSTFTIETWVKPDYSQNSGYYEFFNHGNLRIYVRDYNDGVFDCGSVFGGDLRSSQGSVPENQWSHVALVVDSGAAKLYVNGVNDQNANYTGINLSGTGQASIGAAMNAYALKGSLSNFRIVKGTAVYTSNFAPSVEPLTNITNTVLLCCNGSTPTSSTVTPNTITKNDSTTAGNSQGTITAAQDCPLSSSYLCGGQMKNSALSPNTTNCPYLFKSGITLHGSQGTDTDIIYAHREDPTSTYFSSSDYQSAVITSDGLYAYLVGTCSSNVNLNGGGNQTGGAWAGHGDAYLLKINYLTGALISRTCIPSVGNPGGWTMLFGIAIDSSGNIYCGGRCRQGWSGYMAYVVKFNSSLVIQWQKKIANVSYIQNLAVDSSDNLYAVATSTTSGYKGGYMMKITSSGSLDWVTKMTINGFDDRYPFTVGLKIAGENDNLYTVFDYNKNPSSNSATASYRQQLGCVKYPNSGNITGTYGDLVLTEVTNLSLSNATMGSRASSLSYEDERRQNITRNDNTDYGNGNPTFTTTSL